MIWVHSFIQTKCCFCLLNDFTPEWLSNVSENCFSVYLNFHQNPFRAEFSWRKFSFERLFMLLILWKGFDEKRNNKSFKMLVKVGWKICWDFWGSDKSFWITLVLNLFERRNEGSIQMAPDWIIDFIFFIFNVNDCFTHTQQ